jgi:EAL domain-containing protein (putative c-di-GMP-specific phosphodiesterase class I)
MRVVAEGVETEAQFTLLREAGCDEVQGFLTGRPLSVQDLYQLFSGTSTQFRTGTR